MQPRLEGRCHEIIPREILRQEKATLLSGVVYGEIGCSKMWQAISYYGVLAFEALVGVVGIRLYEEPRFDIVGSLKNGVEIRRYGPRLAVRSNLMGPAIRDATKLSASSSPTSQVPTEREPWRTNGSP